MFRRCDRGKLVGTALGPAELTFLKNMGHFVAVRIPDRKLDKEVYLNIWGPSRNEPPRGSAANEWGGRCCIPGGQGD
eukprot:7825159-Pyramimonas_sp.AAC.1